MANIRNVYQQKFTVSIPREALTNIAENEDLSKADLRVFLNLLTQLNGHTATDPSQPDPENFQKIDIKKISNNLNLSKKKVESAIEVLIDYNILERGSGKSVRNGYRFII